MVRKVDLFNIFSWQADARLSGFIINELNAGLFKDPLYFENGRKISFYNPFATFDPLNGGEANSRSPSKFSLAPA
jgi:hypothetical protein